MILKKHQQLVFEDRYKHSTDHDVTDMWDRVAKAASSVENEPHIWHLKFYRLLEKFKFVPGGRILATAGTGTNHPLFNCYVIDSPDDSRNGIMENIKKMINIMANGGGVGVDLSTLRYKDCPVVGVNGKSSGVVAWANLYSEATGTIQQGGSRRGALLLSLRCDHPDILDFIRAKQDLRVLTNANLSVLVTDAFMEAVKKKEKWPLRWKGKIIANISAERLWEELCTCAWCTGEPGIIFIDTYNKMNNTSYFEQIVTTNPLIS